MNKIKEPTDVHIIHLNRLYATLSQINQTIVRVHDRDTLFKDICTVSVNYGQFGLAWIGLVDETNQVISPVAFAGNEEGYLTHVNVAVPDKERGKGPTGQAFREGRCVCCQDIATDPNMLPWRDEALKRGFRASASVPIRQNSQVIGVFNVYASEPWVFDEKELLLINEIGVDISFALDVIEKENQQKQVTNALLISEARFRHTLDSMLEGCQIIGYDFNYLYVNDSVAKQGRHDSSELIGRSMIEAYPGIENTEMFAVLTRCMNQRTSQHMINKFIYSDGSNGWFELSIQPVPEGVLILSNDISERIKAEEVLRGNDANLEFAQAMARMGSWERNYVTGNAFWSKEMFRLFDLDPEKELPPFDAIVQLIHPEDRSVFAEIHKQVRETGMPATLEFRKYSNQGKLLHFETRIQRIQRESDHSCFLTGMIIDITERKNAELEIQKLNQTLEDRVAERTSQLEAANKELEAFSYSVSHDLRAPLRHINGYLELLAKRNYTQLDEKGKHYMDSIAEASNQMGTLIDDLLNFSRAGRMEMKPDNMDMNKAINDALIILEQEIKGRAIEWKQAPMPNVYADYAMIRQVWVNLLSNALKYSRKRAVAVIEIGVTDEADEFVCFVRDNGAGFDMNYAQKLFGVFQRLHSVEEFEGTGIGLANVRQVIKRHKGRTWAEGEIDKGATFYFSIPKFKEDRA